MPQFEKFGVAIITEQKKVVPIFPDVQMFWSRKELSIVYSVGDLLAPCGSDLLMNILSSRHFVSPIELLYYPLKWGLRISKKEEDGWIDDKIEDTTPFSNNLSLFDKIFMSLLPKEFDCSRRSLNM